MPDFPSASYPRNAGIGSVPYGIDRGIYPGSIRNAIVSPHRKEQEAERTLDRRDNTLWPDRPQFLLPAEEQHASKWNSGLGVFYTRFDEALRDNWLNALAMRRSVFIEELLLHRQLPVSCLEWHIDVDDPKDPDQANVAKRLTKLCEAIPSFQDMRRYLYEDLWYGKYGSQVTWGEMMIDGRKQVTVTDHQPVNGDSIVFRFDGTPGVLTRTGWEPRSPVDQGYMVDLKKEKIKTPWIGMTDRARALFLGDQFWRDHFIISKFMPTATDYMFEGDQAAKVHGRGFRDILYWDYQFRDDLRSWAAEALERISANGMLYGFYDLSNPTARDHVIAALKSIIRDNVAAFPYDSRKNQTPAKIEHIEVSQVGYEIIFKWVETIEDSMRRCVLGQSLTSMAQGGGGLGNEAAAELQGSSFEHVAKTDATRQQEVLTRDLLGPMIRFNDWEYRGKCLRGELPFQARFAYSIEKRKIKERSDVLFGAFDRGWEISKSQSYDELSLSIPKDESDILKKPDAAPGMPGAPGGGAGPGGPPGPNGQPNGNGKPGFGVKIGPDGKLKIHPPVPKVAGPRFNGNGKPPAPVGPKVPGTAKVMAPVMNGVPH